MTSVLANLLYSITFIALGVVLMKMVYWWSPTQDRELMTAYHTLEAARMRIDVLEHDQKVLRMQLDSAKEQLSRMVATNKELAAALFSSIHQGKSLKT